MAMTLLLSKEKDLQYRVNHLRLPRVHVTVRGRVTLEADGLTRLEHVAIWQMVT